MSRDPFQDLDEDQRKVVAHLSGPGMVVAGAGSGKTRALIQRIANLVLHGTKPEQILATTFTRKAAGEIRDRLQYFGVQCETKDRPGVRVGTLHSTAYEILRQSSPLGQWEVNQGFQKSLARTLLEGAGEDVEEAIRPDELLQFISLAKNFARRPNDVGIKYDSWFKAYGEMEQTYLSLYSQFENARISRKLLTYDDMLLDAFEILRDNPGARAKWANRFEHVSVDEAQDTNLVQFGIVETLARVHGNYVIIGDPFQSIYSWRGAYPVYMRDFPQRYPTAVVYTMGKNYRCAQSILTKASAVIGNSAASDFAQMKLEAMRPQVGKADLVGTPTDTDQASWVVDQIATLLRRGVKPPDIAVLYRLKMASKFMEGALIKRGISYCRLDGVPFFERTTVRTLVNLLALTVHPDWIEAAVQALDAIKFIGPATLQKLRTAPGEGIFAKCQWLGSKPRGVKIQQRQCDNLLQFAAVIQACADAAPIDALNYILEQLQFADTFDTKKLDADEGRADVYSDIAALKQRMEDFETIDELVDHAHKLAGDQDDVEGKIGNRIVLSTIHRVKGLEFPYVFILSAVEGVLPAKFAVLNDDPEEIDEERRLFYVAATRAKDALSVVVPKSRMAWQDGSQNLVSCTPSRFVDEGWK